MLALMRIDEEKTIGRPSLMKSLNLHEAQAKTLIKRLKESILIRASITVPESKEGLTPCLDLATSSMI